jgi:SSS family solute:Na+ symporter
MKWLRLSMIGIAAFAWVFSMIFQIREYIFMYCQITGAIYLGGAGSVLIGGLYWKRGTTAAAWWSMCTGSFLAFCSIIVVNVIWPYLLPQLKSEYLHVGWLQNLPVKFPVNSMLLAFGSALVASAVYVIVSLFTRPDPDFEMDKLLHRGRYAEIDAAASSIYSSNGMRQKFKNFMGISDEFTPGDKFICAFSVLLSMFYMTVFVIGTVLYLMFGWKDDGWIKWWKFKTAFMIFLAIVTSVWLLLGGIRDFKQLFVDMARIKRDKFDDGIIHHENSKIEMLNDCIDNNSVEIKSCKK